MPRKYDQDDDGLDEDIDVLTESEVEEYLEYYGDFPELDYHDELDFLGDDDDFYKTQ